LYKTAAEDLPNAMLDSAIPEAVLESMTAVDCVVEEVVFLLEKEGVVLHVCDCSNAKLITCCDVELLIIGHCRTSISSSSLVVFSKVAGCLHMAQHLAWYGYASNQCLTHAA